MQLSISKVLLLIAVILFVLVALGVTFASAGTVELLAAGLAFFAAAFLVP